MSTKGTKKHAVQKTARFSGKVVVYTRKDETKKFVLSVSHQYLSQYFCELCDDFCVLINASGTKGKSSVILAKLGL